MDELIKQFGQYSGAGGTVTLVQAGAAILSAFVLSLVIAYVYRETYRGTSYSQFYAHTLVIMCVTVAVIMLIIGSNIARAFSLVGALSIIRFRSAVKDTRDVAFIFLVMAIGMECGTRFFDIAILFTCAAAGIIFFLTKFNIGAKPSHESVLKVLVSSDADYEQAFDEVFYVHLRSHALLSVDSVSDDMLELVYSIVLKRGKADQQLLGPIRAVPGCRRVSLLKGLEGHIAI